MISLEMEPIDNGKKNAPVSLPTAFPTCGETALRMACAELVAKGILHDEGIGRWAMGAMKYFVPTDLAKWYSSWITQFDRTATASQNPAQTTFWNPA